MWLHFAFSQARILKPFQPRQYFGFGNLFKNSIFSLSARSACQPFLLSQCSVFSLSSLLNAYNLSLFRPAIGPSSLFQLVRFFLSSMLPPPRLTGSALFYNFTKPFVFNMQVFSDSSTHLSVHLFQNLDIKSIFFKPDVSQSIIYSRNSQHCAPSCNYWANCCDWGGRAVHVHHVVQTIHTIWEK